MQVIKQCLLTYHSNNAMIKENWSIAHSSNLVNDPLPWRIGTSRSHSFPGIYTAIASHEPAANSVYQAHTLSFFNCLASYNNTVQQALNGNEVIKQ